MLKLTTNEFSKILPLFNELDIHFPIVQAVIENNLNGDNFLQNGVGFCALHDDEVVCVCQSLVLLPDKIEFDIFTPKDYRNLNLGYFTSKGLIDYFISNNLAPY